MGIALRAFRPFLQRSKRYDRLSCGAESVATAGNQPDADASVSAARALEFVADARAVVALLKLLESRDEAVATAAASSLGRSADINAVQPLLNRLEGFLVGADLRTAVRTAVTELQSSANQLSQGGLTVVDEDRTGGLSQVDEAENTSTE